MQLPASRPAEHRRALQHHLRLGDQGAIPAGAILFGQQDELTVDRPRVFAGSMEQQQREQTLRLRFAGQRVSDHASEPHGVVRDIPVGRRVASRDEVRLAVHDRHDGEHDVEPLRPLGPSGMRSGMPVAPIFRLARTIR